MCDFSIGALLCLASPAAVPGVFWVCIDIIIIMGLFCCTDCAGHRGRNAPSPAARDDRRDSAFAPIDGSTAPSSKWRNVTPH